MPPEWPRPGPVDVDFRGVRGGLYRPAPGVRLVLPGFGLSGPAVDRAGVARPRPMVGVQARFTACGPGVGCGFPPGAGSTVGPRPWCPPPPAGGSAGVWGSAPRCLLSGGALPCFRGLRLRHGWWFQGGVSGAARRFARCSRKRSRGACGLRPVPVRRAAASEPTTGSPAATDYGRRRERSTLRGAPR